MKITKQLNRPSPEGKPHVLRYPLAAEREGKTLKFQIMALKDLPWDHTIEDDIYLEEDTGAAIQVVEGYLTVSTYADGNPGEVFLTLGKEGHEQHGWADTWARMFSVLLQAGMHPAQLYGMFKSQSFAPQGMTNLKQVPICKSIPDLVARWMEVNFPPTKTVGGLSDYETMLETVSETK